MFVVARPTEAMKKAKKCLNTSAFKARIGFYRLEQWSALMFQQCQNWFVFYGPMVRIGFIVSLRQHSSTLYF
ncbi:MAG: hypothetical protein OFPII_39870 [Osedax symbiont Rs1]|nr:MAG: hypothetical protein OFPII_39870 [Osedax symbiont Rs1]